MKRTVFLLAAAVALALTGCGKEVPKLGGLSGDEASSGESPSLVAEDSADEADREPTSKVEVYDADGEDFFDASGEEEEAEEAPVEETPVEEAPVEVGDDKEHGADGTTKGFVGEFAFCYDEESWEVLAQPGIGYQLTHRQSGEGCQIMISAEGFGDIDTIMEALTAEYEGTEFEAASEEELNDLPVQRVRGTQGDIAIELLFSQPKEGGEVLVVRFLSEGQSQEAKQDGRCVLDSFSMR